jgi:hypothetical protein
MNRDGRLSLGWWTVVVVALMLAPQPAAGISLTLRDTVDPVPPGATLTYTVRVNNDGDDGGGGVGAFCFNPPPQCITGVANCDITPPGCVGNSFTGYSCINAANTGANCGVGDPPVPSLSLCVPDISGVCTGGLNAGLPCNGSGDCPGNSCVCEFAFNEGSFCCTGNPPTPDGALCIANPTGICSAGPNVGQTCTAPHGAPTEECPGESGGTDLVVELPIPPETTFVDGNIILSGPGATVDTDGTNVIFTLPPLDPCGVAGTPQCPLLTANFLVNMTTPVGTIIQNQAFSGLVSSTTIKTTVNSFGLKRAVLRYPSQEGRDRFIYRSVFTLVPSASINPPSEAFRVELNTASTTMFDLNLPPGSILPFSATTQQFKTREPGLSRVTIRELAPQHYSVILKGALLDLPPLDELDLVLSITIGDDVLHQNLSMLVKRGGRKFVALKE